jgi:glycosyltransferase involved in cell wall biosynthesis
MLKHNIKIRDSQASRVAPDPPRVLFAVTASIGLVLLREQCEYLLKSGFDVFVVCSPGKGAEALSRSGVRIVEIPMKREISPLADLVSLWRMYRWMSRARLDLVNASTPKAGLLAGMSAWLAGVPCRIFTIRGLRSETTSGWKRCILRVTERLSCVCAHRVVCVSPSLREKVVTLTLAPLHKTVVLAAGSSHGVEVGRFAPTPQTLREVDFRKQELGIPRHAPVVGFVGRFVRDKGIAEMMMAYSLLHARFPELRLLLVGDWESGDPVPGSIRTAIETDPNIIRTGFICDPTFYYHLMDVLAHPTYREGFPNCVLEAHAAGKPVVTTRATGAVDSVVNGVTGLLVPVGDGNALADALESLITNVARRAAMGAAGQQHVRDHYHTNIVAEALSREYRDLLSAKGVPIYLPSPQLAGLSAS